MDNNVNESLDCSPNEKFNTSTVMKNEARRCFKRLAQNRSLKSPQLKRKTLLKNLRQLKKKVKTYKTATNNTKLTEWLAKSSEKPVNKIDNDSCYSKENSEIDDKIKEAANKKENQEHHENYLRYGIKMPSFDEIMKFQKKNKAYKELMDNIQFEELVQNKVSPVKFESKREPVTSLNCMSLTPPEIKKLFYKNLQYAKDIYNGSFYSERHQKFKNQNIIDDYTINDLRYSPSLCVFTIDQKDIILSLLHDEFDNENSFCLNQYYYKVLLPELCLKIFMDVHNMNKKAAVQYLEDIPVEDD